jgi:3-isopropylmalate dehydratase
MTKNGMLPISLPQSEVDKLMAEAEKEREFEVNLESETIICYDGQSETLRIKFDVNPFRKHCLVNGLDEIGLTLQKHDAIAEYEAVRTQQWPWLDGHAYKVKAAASNAQTSANTKMDW